MKTSITKVLKLLTKITTKQTSDKRKCLRRIRTLDKEIFLLFQQNLISLVKGTLKELDKLLRYLLVTLSTLIWLWNCFFYTITARFQPLNCTPWQVKLILEISSTQNKMAMMPEWLLWKTAVDILTIIRNGLDDPKQFNQRDENPDDFCCTEWIPKTPKFSPNQCWVQLHYHYCTYILSVYFTFFIYFIT